MNSLAEMGRSMLRPYESGRDPRAQSGVTVPRGLKAPASEGGRYKGKSNPRRVQQRVAATNLC
jgi:hypothetical protein